jgi:hypothetical protein
MITLEWWVVYIGKFSVDTKDVEQVKKYYSLVKGRSNPIFREKHWVAYFSVGS